MVHAHAIPIAYPQKLLVLAAVYPLARIRARNAAAVVSHALEFQVVLAPALPPPTVYQWTQSAPLREGFQTRRA